MPVRASILSCLFALLAIPGIPRATAEPPPAGPEWLGAARAELVAELTARHGEGQRVRLERGIDQTASLWRPEDGDREVFSGFVRRNFAGDQETLDLMFARYQRLLEQLDGHMLEIILEFRRQSDLDLGPTLPFDETFAGYDPSAHVDEDFFANKLAFTVLLNFPLTTLEQRLREGESWSRREWAEARLAQRFSKRVPAEVQLELARAGAEADRYIAGYNIWMHHLVDGEGERLFPAGMRLLSHWNLRDEIKASYRDAERGLAKQRTIQRVMERIVDQSIPAVVVDNPGVDWNPFTNEVAPASVEDGGPAAAAEAVRPDAEPDTRYRMLLGTFRAARRVDPFSPTAPTLIARRFDDNREIPEERVRGLFEQVLGSPHLARAARLIERRLGRKLEPFDLWYDGFRPRPPFRESELDDLVRERYPTAAAFEGDIPRLLGGLGFEEARARELAANIVVEPARGSGHAWGAAMREAPTRLRTRVGAAGMDYKGYNIAVHEMGHNVEQTISLVDIDHTLLAGVPNTAFTEALAFVFQARDLELLGLAVDDPEARALRTLDDFWGAAEIASVALVDMGVWHWMYDHPEAEPAELKKATLEIAREVWNRYWAPLLGGPDATLLAIYSHMIDSFLYLPDYPIGHLIAFQIEELMEKAGEVGTEFDRVARIGNLTPDLWMRRATGAPVGAEALLAATGRALERLEGGSAASGSPAR